MSLQDAGGKQRAIAGSVAAGQETRAERGLRKEAAYQEAIPSTICHAPDARNRDSSSVAT
jgi:hypothetical protein